jgi:hypothetical protein
MGRESGKRSAGRRRHSAELYPHLGLLDTVPLGWPCERGEDLPCGGDVVEALQP